MRLESVLPAGALAAMQIVTVTTQIARDAGTNRFESMSTSGVSMQLLHL
jgi:hypothetical protein